MKAASALLFVAVALAAPAAYARDKNPAGYPLIVHVLASSRETQLVYRGTDCTSSAYGEIDETDTLTARVYTTCSPNWAAYRYAFAEFDVTNTEPTINNTVRFLGQCANTSGAALASRILGGLGNTMATVGGSPDQQAQAEQRSRQAQPIPPSRKCDLTPGDYAGRWQKGELELLLTRSNGKYATVSFITNVVTQKQESPSRQLASALPQDCPIGMTRVGTSFGSYCKGQDESASKNAMFSSTQTEASSAVSNSDLQKAGIAQDCPQGMTRISTSFGSYCDARAQTTNQHASQTSAQLESTSTMGAKVSGTQGTRDTQRAVNQTETQCHALIAQAAIVRLEWDIYAADLEKALYENQLRISGWMDQLDDCVNHHPQQMSIDDWQKLVSIYARMQREFDADFEARVAITTGAASSDEQNKSLRAKDQEWLSDYNALVHKYNDLVHDYDEQRDLLIRLSSAPPALPPARTFVHCSTFNSGNIGWIDCY